MGGPIVCVAWKEHLDSIRLDSLSAMFGVEKPIIGMVHLWPLPGSPGYMDYGMHTILDHAREDAGALLEGGVDGLIVENMWDLPYYVGADVPLEAVTAQAVAARDIVEMADVPVGINVVHNGTFFNSAVWFPHIGYNRGFELGDPNDRRKHDLPPIQRFAKLEDMSARQNTYLGTEADWIDFETVVSTSPDQIFVVVANIIASPGIFGFIMASLTAALMSTVDTLINAAGGNSPKATTSAEFPFFDLPEDALRFVFDLNILGTILPSQAFGRGMAERGEGVVLNVSSMNAFRPLTRIPAYSSAKAGVSNFTQWLAVHMAQEYSPRIRVNAIAPGFFLTAQNRFLLTDEETGTLTPRGQTIIDHTPMRRFGDPKDLLGTVLWLLSSASAFVSGVVVPVDGGFSAFSGV